MHHQRQRVAPEKQPAVGQSSSSSSWHRPPSFLASRQRSGSVHVTYGQDDAHMPCCVVFAPIQRKSACLLCTAVITFTWAVQLPSREEATCHKPQSQRACLCKNSLRSWIGILGRNSVFMCALYPCLLHNPHMPHSTPRQRPVVVSIRAACCSNLHPSAYMGKKGPRHCTIKSCRRQLYNRGLQC